MVADFVLRIIYMLSIYCHIQKEDHQKYPIIFNYLVLDTSYKGPKTPMNQSKKINIGKNNHQKTKILADPGKG